MAKVIFIIYFGVDFYRYILLQYFGSHLYILVRLHMAKVLPGMEVDLGRCQLLLRRQQNLGEGNNGATEVGRSQQRFGFFSAVTNISALVQWKT